MRPCLKGMRKTWCAGSEARGMVFAKNSLFQHQILATFPFLPSPVPVSTHFLSARKGVSYSGTSWTSFL